MPAAPSGQNAAQKTCIVCGQDVSNKPRVKDAQGRYVCAGECQQKLAAKAASPRSVPAAAVAAAPKAPPAPAEDDVMSKIIGASPMINAQNCPECAAPMTAGSVVCVRCGHNTQTGKSLRTQVVKIKEPPLPKAAGARRRGGGQLPGESWAMPVGLVLAALGATAFVSPAAGAVVVIGLWVIALINFIWGVVIAFQTDNTKWGIYGICVIVPLVNIVTGLLFLYYMIAINENRWNKNLYGGALIGMIIGYVGLIMTLGPEFLNVAPGAGGTP